MMIKILVLLLALLYSSLYILRNVRLLKDCKETKKRIGALLEMIACIAVLSIAVFWCIGENFQGLWNVAMILSSVFIVLLLVGMAHNAYQYFVCQRKGCMVGHLGVFVTNMVFKLLGIAVFAKILYDALAHLA